MVLGFGCPVTHTVSVPSRGILFPNVKMEEDVNHVEKVSVPSRGILFPNNETINFLE